jgi:hypothetical protein
MRIFVLTATYELRVSRKSHLRDHPSKQPACHNEPLVEGRLTRGPNTVADLWSQDLLYTEPFVAGSFVAGPFKTERFVGVPAA